MNHNRIKTSISAFAVSLAIAICTAGCHNPGENYRTCDGFAQGGTFHLVYELPGGNAIASLPDSLQAWFTRIDKSLSGYDTTSPVSRINRGENPALDNLFIECFNSSKEVYKATGGAFDISAAPLFDIWGFGFRTGEEPTPEKIDSIKQFVGMEKLSIVFDSLTNACYLQKGDPRMKLNFNAIAQGFTCDYICTKLEGMGISNYLLEVGGEIMCKGVNRKGKEWSVAIDKPVDGNFVPGESVQAVLELSGRGLVTSGNYRKFYIKDGKKFSHTIDPATGYPVKHNLLSATVIAANATLADAYATYLMVIGIDQAREFLENNKEFDALLVYGEQEQMKVFSTKGVKQRKLK